MASPRTEVGRGGSGLQHQCGGGECRLGDVWNSQIGQAAFEFLEVFSRKSVLVSWMGAALALLPDTDRKSESFASRNVQGLSCTISRKKIDLTADRLHELPIFFRQRIGPDLFVAGIGQDVAIFDHPPRRQLGNINPYARSSDARGLAHRISHEFYHLQLVLDAATRSDTAVYKDLVVKLVVNERHAAHEMVARFDLLEDHLREERWCTGDFGMDARDFCGNPTLLVRRELAFPDRAYIGRHLLRSPSSFCCAFRLVGPVTLASVLPIGKGTRRPHLALASFAAVQHHTAIEAKAVSPPTHDSGPLGGRFGLGGGLRLAR